MNEETKNKIKTWFKKVCGYCIAVVSGVIGTIICRTIIHNNRKSVARNRELERKEQETHQRATDATRRIEESTCQLGRNTQRITEILQEVRKQKLD